MSKTRLTAQRIAEFEVPEGKQQAFLWDSISPGLAVRATQNSKSYIFQGKLEGKDIRITIGDIRSWYLESPSAGVPGAREEARRLQTLIDRGIDPRQDKREQQAAARARGEAAYQMELEAEAEARRQCITVREAWDAYIEDRKNKWGDRHLDAHYEAIREGAPLDELMKKRLAEITPDCIKDWLVSEKEKRPTFAGNCFRKFKTFIGWCEENKAYRGIADPTSCTTRLVKDERPKTKPKSDCLQREQLTAWFDAVLKISNPYISSYLQILLLTGARRNELTELKWSDVDFRWNTLLLADKIEDERIIPLTPYIRHLLLNLKTINDTPPPEYRILHGKKIKNDLASWKPSKWVFISKTAESGRIAEPAPAHRRVLTAAGIPHVTIHGLRRTFKTLSEWCEIPAGAIAQIMGHKPSALSEKHYTVRPIDLLRLMHTRYEFWMLEQASISFDHESNTLKVVTGKQKSRHLLPLSELEQQMVYTVRQLDEKSMGQLHQIMLRMLAEGKQDPIFSTAA